MNKRLLSVFSLFFIAAIGFAQVPKQFYFYKGDSLDGFDVPACYQAALVVAGEHHLTPPELRGYVHVRERNYILNKYHIPVNQPADVMRGPISSPLATACNNVDFENGNYTGWTGYIGYNANSSAALTSTAAGISTLGLNSPETSCSYHTLVTTGTDPNGNFPMLDPGGGAYALRLGGENINYYYGGSCTGGSGGMCGGETIQTSFPVTTANAMFTYKYAVVLNSATHNPGEMPYFRAEVLNAAGTALPCLQYYIQSTNGVVPAGFIDNGAGVYYCNWTSNSLNLLAYVGQTLTVRFTAAGCIYGAHFGYAYVDCTCGPVQVLASTPEVCLGGTLTLTAPPVSPGNTYQWSTLPSGTAGIVGSSTGQSVVINANGTYEVTVTQGPGCTYKIDTAIAFYPLPVVTITPKNASCVPGNDGTATANVTGGNTPYTYSWSPGAPAGQGTNVITGLGAGTYTCLVTTTNGCTASQTVVITQASGHPAATFTTTPASCSPGADGTANATPSGGTAPYTYTWSPAPGGGQGTANVTGLSAGTYTLSMTDVNGCIGSSTVVITQPGGPTTTQANTNVTCFGGTDGTATVAGSGGTAPLTYTWAPGNPTGQGTTSVTGLAAGTYTCTVKDNKGCAVVATVTITQPAAVTATNTQVNEQCFGGSTGSATVIPAGGTPGYTYTWAPAPTTGQGTATAGGLPIGTYTCTINDSKNCSTTSPVTLTQPTQVTATTTNTPASCGATNGSVTASASGGTGTITYSWNAGTGANTATASGLGSGTYTCTIKDANGCTITATATVSNTGGPTVTTGAVTNITCFGLCNGSIPVTATGGLTPYTYSWSPAPGGGQATATATALCAGTYSCTVTDAQGCSSVTTGTVTQPTPLVVTTTGTNVSCFGRADGTATGNASGGTPGYTYTWTPAPGGGQGTLNATGLAAGNYTLTVKDLNGCTANSVLTITQPTLLTVNAAGLNATCNGLCNGQLICIPNGGTSAYTYSWNTGCTTASCTNICAGIYTATVTDAHGCVATDTATVNQPSKIVLSMFPTPSHCSHSDGVDSVTASGGTPGYTYTWSPGPGSSTNFYHNIPSGTYTVLVHDANKCADSMSNTVPNLPGVNITFVSSVNVSCFGGADGSITVAGSGGFPPYTYTWSPVPGGGQGTVTATGLTAQTYTCVINDAAHCTNQVIETILQPPPLVVTPMAPDTICYGSCTNLTATASGGTPLYTFSWSTNGTAVTPPVCPITTTTYTVTCSDSHNCPASGNVKVIVRPLLEVVTPLAQAICPGKSSQLNATATGGNGGPYTYSWMPNTGLSSTTIPNPVATPPGTTTYTVIVSDNCGTPTDSATVLVTVYPPPAVVFTSTDTSGCAPICITFTGVSNPACASATWDFGDGKTGTGCSSVKHCYTTAGTYNVTYNVIDVDGCPGTYTLPHYIDAHPRPTAAFSLSPQPTTILSPEITFADHSSNDVISWAWTFGDFAGGNSILQNPKYTYPDTGCYTATLIVTNQFGCTDITHEPVCIGPYFTFYAPNTFTPNGDGKNDIWMPYGIGIDPKNYDLIMFDRWGNLMFETHVWGDGWDGRANAGADIAQIDTYVWKVNLKDVFGIKHSYVGHCNIIK
jgi:gliding motility-associated-like protein